MNGVINPQMAFGRKQGSPAPPWSINVCLVFTNNFISFVHKPAQVSFVLNLLSPLLHALLSPQSLRFQTAIPTGLSASSRHGPPAICLHGKDHLPTVKSKPGTYAFLILLQNVNACWSWSNPSFSKVCPRHCIIPTATQLPGRCSACSRPTTQPVQNGTQSSQLLLLTFLSNVIGNTKILFQSLSIQFISYHRLP